MAMTAKQREAARKKARAAAAKRGTTVTAKNREEARAKARASAKKGGQRGMAAKDMPKGWANKKKKPTSGGFGSGRKGSSGFTTGGGF